MKIAIVGLGAASFGTFLALEKYCEKISCLDIFTKKQKISDEKKIYSRDEIVNFYKKLNYSKPIPPKINMQTKASDTSEIFKENYEAMDLWGSSCLPLSKEDLAYNRFEFDEYTESYRDIAKAIRISGCENDLIEEFLGDTYINEEEITLDEKLENLLNNFDKSINKNNIILGKARLALSHNKKSNNAESERINCECSFNNCNIHNLFLSNDIERYIQDSRLKNNIIYEKVEFIDFENKKLTYNSIKKKQYDVIFICAGPKETMGLLNRSLKIKNFQISDSQSYILPMFSFKKNLRNAKDVSFSLTSLIGILRQDHSINEKEFMQIYKISEELWYQALPKMFWPLSKILSRFIYACVIYLDDKHKINYIINYKNNNVVHKKIEPNSKSKIKKFVRKIRLLLGDNFKVFKIFLFKKKTSHHFGNLKVDDIPLKTFAHKYEKKGIYFCGSATFTKLPSISPTFTIMADSNILAKKAILDFK